MSNERETGRLKAVALIVQGDVARAQFQSSSGLVVKQDSLCLLG